MHCHWRSHWRWRFSESITSYDIRSKAAVDSADDAAVDATVVAAVVSAGIANGVEADVAAGVILYLRESITSYASRILKFSPQKK